MTLGKAAVPFAGGRVVSLFSHKKYDSLVIEYLELEGGFHSVIFRVPKGQGDVFKNDLAAHGTQLSRSEGPILGHNTRDDSLPADKWSIHS